eukprot:2466126-Ditylum_brightwellii.AAC.1
MLECLCCAILGHRLERKSEVGISNLVSFVVRSWDWIVNIPMDGLPYGCVFAEVTMGYPLSTYLVSMWDPGCCMDMYWAM